MASEGENGNSESESEAELSLEGDDDEKPYKAVTSLLESVNQSCATARGGWLFLLSVLAYLFIAVAGVTHRDLFLDSPIKLPLLGTDLALSRFFWFAPLVILLVYFSILLNHAALADKLRHLDDAFRGLERKGAAGKGLHPKRLELSTYFFAQILAGNRGSLLRQALAKTILWITLGLFPVIVLMFFQIAFLPYHDEFATTMHQAFVATAALCSLFLIGMTKRNEASIKSSRDVWTRRGGIGLFVFIQFLIFVPFAILVASVPDSTIDRITRSWTRYQTSVPLGANESEQRLRPERAAFGLTAYFFEGNVNYVTGQATSWFARNLVATEVPMTKDRLGGEDTARLSFRNRNLEYATLDRSIFRGADFTGANLFGASFREADLRKAKFGCAKKGRAPELRDQLRKQVGNSLPNADYAERELRNCLPTEPEMSGCAILVSADLGSADLRESNLRNAKATGSTFRKSNIQGADFSGASMCLADFSETKAQRTDFKDTLLLAADLSDIAAQGAAFDRSDLRLSNLSDGKFELSSFESADLTASYARGARFIGANLTNAMLNAIDLRNAIVSGHPEGGPSEGRLQFADFTDLKHQMPNGEWRAEFSKALDELGDVSLSEWLAKKAGEAVGWTSTAEQTRKNSLGEETWQELSLLLDRKADANHAQRRLDFVYDRACRDELMFAGLVQRYIKRNSGYDTGWGTAQTQNDVAAQLISWRRIAAAREGLSPAWAAMPWAARRRSRKARPAVDEGDGVARPDIQKQDVFLA